MIIDNPLICVSLNWVASHAQSMLMQEIGNGDLVANMYSLMSSKVRRSTMISAFHAILRLLVFENPGMPILYAAC